MFSLFALVSILDEQAALDERRPRKQVEKTDQK